MRSRLFLAPCTILLLIGLSCGKSPGGGGASETPKADSLRQSPVAESRRLFAVPVERAVKIKRYFPYIDQIVQQYDSLVPYRLTEHLLVRFNPWIIDSLAAMDYYLQKARGEVVLDQRELPVFHPGDTIYIPDSIAATALQREIDSAWLDVNIPEFRLRVVRGTSDTLFTFPVRVGKNKKQFQKLLGKETDLRTQPGSGKIIKINRDPPWFLDPHTGEKFMETKRDDGRRTRMPLIPWLEPEINGRRLGQLIHPTTNPGSLNRAASNGCIGVGEYAAWFIYYYAPVGTPVRIRYDLLLVPAEGDTLRLEDVYGWEKSKTKKKAQPVNRLHD
ncbi:MAG: L,D-transpeptidase [Saprospiraceae bacterium]